MGRQGGATENKSCGTASRSLLSAEVHVRRLAARMPPASLALCRKRAARVMRSRSPCAEYSVKEKTEAEKRRMSEAEKRELSEQNDLLHRAEVRFVVDADTTMNKVKRAFATGARLAAAELHLFDKGRILARPHETVGSVRRPMSPRAAASLLTEATQITPVHAFPHRACFVPSTAAGAAAVASAALLDRHDDARAQRRLVSSGCICV